MADKKPTDAPEKTGQAVTGGDKTAPGKQAPPPPEEKAPVPPAGGKEDKAPPAGPADKAPSKQAPPPPGKGKIVGVEFPSGKKIEIVDAPGKTALDPKAPGGDKKAGPEVTDEGDSLDQWNKEQAALDGKKPGRKPRASKTTEKSGAEGKSDKPPARRGRPKKTEQTAPAKQEAPAPAPEPPRAPKSRNRSYISIYPSFTRSRSIPLAFVTMRKCRR